MSIFLSQLNYSRMNYSQIELAYGRQGVLYTKDTIHNEYYAIVGCPVHPEILIHDRVFIADKRRLKFNNYKDIQKMQMTGKMYENTQKPIKLHILTENEILGKYFNIVNIAQI